MNWCSRQDLPVPALPITRNLNKYSERITFSSCEIQVLNEIVKKIPVTTIKKIPFYAAKEIA